MTQAVLPDRHYFKDYDFSELFTGRVRKIKHSRKEWYVDAWASFDTETTADASAGFIVMWTSTICYKGRAVTCWGRTADDAISYFDTLADLLRLSERTRLPVYVHNYSYDYVFLRNFLIDAFGVPVRALAVKTHRYISMIFANGIEFKDSYILAQCSLEKWGRDLGASLQKASGTWDYTKRRTPDTPLTAEEINYACADAETLVACLQLKAAQGGYGVGNIPLTATGYARDAARNAAFETDWKERVHALDMPFEVYERCSRTFQGGITHGNRWHVGSVLHDIDSYDFASSYPFVMCTEKFPASAWVRAAYTLDGIQRDAGDYGFIFDLVLIDCRIKQGRPMPPIAQSKCTRYANTAKFDNGKLLSADLVQIPVNEIDLQIYLDNYDYSGIIYGLETEKGFARGEVYTCRKDYLPQWFTDTIQKYFYDKTCKKDSDAQQYQYAKSLLNSQYGMCAQRPVRDDIIEEFGAVDVEAKRWHIDKKKDPAAELAKYYRKYNYFLPYQWGMYVTSYARRNLYALGACCADWIYCDTDSVKGRGWDLAAVSSYNEKALAKLAARGIQPVTYKGRTYSMGVAEHDATYTEFITLGAKRYAYRDASDNQLHITVAGVPKRGVEVLHDDIYKFARGLVFHDTGKLVPEYHTQDQVQQISVDGCTVRVGSWVNLVPADYLLDMTDRFDALLDTVIDWEKDFSET